MLKELKKKINNLDEIRAFHRPNHSAFELLSTEESPDMSMAIIVLNGLNDQVKNKESNAMYIVLSGIGYFTIWDGGYPELNVVRAGDVVKIHSGTPYQDFGAHLVMLAIDHPGFNPDNVQVLKKN